VLLELRGPGAAASLGTAVDGAPLALHVGKRARVQSSRSGQEPSQEDSQAQDADAAIDLLPGAEEPPGAPEGHGWTCLRSGDDTQERSPRAGTKSATANKKGSSTAAVSGSSAAGTSLAVLGPTGPGVVPGGPALRGTSLVHPLGAQDTWQSPLAPSPSPSSP